MTDGPALLKAVLANPEEDTPRLVYADWLDENGDPARAEFIRGQIRLAGMNAWDEGYTELDVRCRGLERAHPEWLGPVGAFAKRGEVFSGDREYPFRRGFLARVEMTPKEFSKHRTHLFDKTPAREVQFDLSEMSHSLAKRPELARLTGAEFAFVRGYSECKLLLACVQKLGPLDHFGVVGSQLPEQDANVLLSASALGEVSSLAVTGTPLAPSAEATLAGLPWPNLRKLTRVWVSQLDWLRAAWVPQLEELTLHDTEPNLSIGQRRLLADVLPATDVRRLNLGWWVLDSDGGAALGAAVARSRVESLALAQTPTPAAVARALFAPDVLGKLRALYLSWAALDAAVVARLLGSGLRVCALDHVTVEALAALRKAPGLPEVADLRLGLVWQTPEDRFHEVLAAVLDAGTLPRLVRLTLGDTTPRTDTAVRNFDEIAFALANNPAAARLRELQLDSVSRAGARALAESPHLDGLQLLAVSVWPKDQGAEDALKERFGAAVNLESVSVEY